MKNYIRIIGSLVIIFTLTLIILKGVFLQNKIQSYKELDENLFFHHTLIEFGARNGVLPSDAEELILFTQEAFNEDYIDYHLKGMNIEIKIDSINNRFIILDKTAKKGNQEHYKLYKDLKLTRNLFQDVSIVLFSDSINNPIYYSGFNKNLIFVHGSVLKSDSLIKNFTNSVDSLFKLYYGSEIDGLKEQMNTHGDYDLQRHKMVLYYDIRDSNMKIQYVSINDSNIKEDYFLAIDCFLRNQPDIEKAIITIPLLPVIILN